MYSLNNLFMNPIQDHYGLDSILILSGPICMPILQSESPILSPQAGKEKMVLSNGKFDLNTT